MTKVIIAILGLAAMGTMIIGAMHTAKRANRLVGSYTGTVRFYERGDERSGSDPNFAETIRANRNAVNSAAQEAFGTDETESRTLESRPLDRADTHRSNGVAVSAF